MTNNDNLTKEERTVLGCIFIPAFVIMSPLYLAALILAWPVVIPLTLLVVFLIWRWNEKAKKRRHTPEGRAEAAAAAEYLRTHQFVYPHPYGSPYVVVADQMWDNPARPEPDSLSDDDEVI